MTQTFPASIKPTYNVQRRVENKQKVVSFADGYEQRLMFGLVHQQHPDVYSLTFNLSDADNFNNTGVSSSDTVEIFLIQRMEDAAYFNWTAPGESAARKWVCDGFNKTIPFLNRAVIKATFRQVFEP